MSGANMFREFIGIVSDIFSMFFIAKYLYLYIAISIGLGTFIISKIVRWFNA